MKPINQAERRKAFLNFLLFFLITVGIIVTTVIISLQVPFKQNTRLIKDMEVAQEEKDFLKSFEYRMEETMTLIDSVNLVPNAYWIDNRIDHNLKEMAAMLDDSAAGKSLCSKVLDNLKTLQSAKQDLRKVGDNYAELEKKDKDIQELKHQVELYQAMIQGANQAQR